MTPEVCPGKSEKAALLNSGTVWPGLRKPSSPPLALLGVRLGQGGKVSAGFDLLHEILGLGFGGGVRLGVRTRGDGDEDVPDLDLILDRILRLVGVVVRLDVGVRDSGLAAGNLLRGEGEIVDLASLGNGIGVAGLVGLEEALELGVGSRT
jgi:hypothetical protein